MRRGLCTAQEEANCRDEVGDENIEWACGECPKKKASSLHPYTMKMLGLAAMQRGGYPFKADDLTIEEWIDLGRFQDVYRHKQQAAIR